MRPVRSDNTLHHLKQRVVHHARDFGMTLPEMRFFILNSMEFASLLEKRVYPKSPSNIWEGKRMIGKKYRIKSGLESSLYYEVVQTGNPSYAYLNDTNSAMTQASVMAHVAGHCEFSELNVLEDSNPDRTERVMWQVEKVNLGRRQMGEKHFEGFWNAAESALPLLSPNSQYNLSRSVDTEFPMLGKKVAKQANSSVGKAKYWPQFETLDHLLRTDTSSDLVERDFLTKRDQQRMNRRGYRLVRPCQDIFGFLRNFAPATNAERAILDYLYLTHAPSDFVMRTQIMNEGWAMYWEKKIMLRLFAEKAVKGVIDYARVFSGVCYPRPFFMRNPYHLGFHMWCHIEELYRKGRVSLAYLEETDRAKKDTWFQKTTHSPIERMRHLVRTISDYEFLRRFLSNDLITKFHLNRLSHRDMARMGVSKRDCMDEDENWVWLEPEPVKQDMLKFYTHFFRPRVYAVDTNFEDGGLLLFHRNDGRRLKASWIKPTLKNIHHIWKGSVHVMSRNGLYSFLGGKYSETPVPELEFDQIRERMQKGEKPLRLH